MYIGKTLNISAIWLFARKNLIITALISTIVVVLYHFLKIKFIAIPFLPVSTIGTAVAFYVGFKNNQAYDRLWEARRLWGGYTNVSRSFAASVISIIQDKDIQKDLLFRHIGYINMVRLQLRKTIPWATGNEDYHRRIISEAEEIKEYDHAVTEFFEQAGRRELYEKYKHKGNIANLALQFQYQKLAQLKRDKILDDFEHSDLCRLLGEMYNIQGGCERIKNTPLYRQYSIFSRIFVKLFIVLLPFALITEMTKLGDYGIWLVVPSSLLISWVFMTMEQIGEASENPFDNGMNDAPISTICRNIEIDIKEMMDDPSIPPKLEPYNNVML